MTSNDVPGSEAPRPDPAAARKAGFLVVDEAMLRSILQAAMLDAHKEARLREEAKVLADQSAELELTRLRKMEEKSKVWWRRWSVPAAALGIVSGVSALGLAIYLIATARSALREDVAKISERTTTEMTIIATEAAAAAVAASEERTDAKIAAIDLQIKSIKQDVHTELSTFREELLRQLRTPETAPP